MINFFNISDFTEKQIYTILNIEENGQILDNKSIGLLFEKHSTRTRLSFTTGIYSLGGNVIDIKFQDLNFSRYESFEDTFRAMDCYLDGLVYRTDDHQKLIQASSFFKNPIINALSDKSHPCQTIGDLLTLYEHFGSFKCNILWMGDMNNVCFSLVEATNLISDLSLIICTPSLISKSKDWPINSNISIVDNLDDVDTQSVNCVMTDVFVSMNDNENNEKVSILKDYSVNSELMSKTDAKSIFMHCLPAKVGYEVSEDVFRSSQSIVWRQAYNRMVAQKKLLQFIYQ